MVSPFNVDIYYMGDYYYSHKKATQKGDHQYIPEHYLEILLRKPRSIENALPLKKGIMPIELQNFMKLNNSRNKNEELVKILLLAREVSNENFLWAVTQSIESGVPTYEMVCFYLDITNLDKSDLEPQIDTEVKIVDLNDYDRLIKNINSGDVDNDENN